MKQFKLKSFVYFNYISYRILWNMGDDLYHLLDVNLSKGGL